MRRTTGITLLRLGETEIKRKGETVASQMEKLHFDELSTGIKIASRQNSILTAFRYTPLNTSSRYPRYLRRDLRRDLWQPMNTRSPKMKLTKKKSSHYLLVELKRGKMLNACPCEICGYFIGVEI